MKRIIFTVAMMLKIVAFSQAKIDFPINPNTGLISISNVINVKGKNRDELKAMANSFFSSKNSAAILTENESNSRKKMKEVPKFSGGQVMTSDSLLVFKLIMKIYLEPKLLSMDISPSNDDYVRFNMNYYIKDEKIKYELTNFEHTNFKGGFDAGGGLFENENPAWKELSGKKRWRMYKEAGINRAKLLAADIEKYFQAEYKGQFNF